MAILEHSRNNLLTNFGIETLKDRYLMPNETPQDMFARVAEAFADNEEHAQRLYDYMSKLWFLPATPILANGGTGRGLPISCFLQNVQDSIKDIIENWKESAWLACRGGGIGAYYGNVRSIGERVGVVGETSGVIPFIKVNDALALAISQGSLRRGSAAMYLPIWHGDIEEFIEIRRATGGDPNRKTLNLHHGVCIDDGFMKAVETDSLYPLISPQNGSIIRQVKARELWIKLLSTRLETGEPYLLFTNRLEEATPDWHIQEGLIPEQSNLCTEITLPTNADRTAVCCLASVNLENWDEWKGDPLFIEDVMRMLDNVLQSFIENAPREMAKAVYSASQERSVGLGVMGWHSYLQSKGLSIENPVVVSLNKKIFEAIKGKVDSANDKLAVERGACPDAARHGYNKRFSYTMAIAPNANISIICGNTSPGIEPYPANLYKHVTLNGTFIVKNKHLESLLDSKGMDIKEVWDKIRDAEGSVQNLEGLTEQEKEVFKTAFEIDQRYLVHQAAARQPSIDQAQSLNIFLPSNIDKKSLHEIHYGAWKLGLKSLYYLRSKSIGRAEKVNLTIGNMDECLGCN